LCSSNVALQKNMKTNKKGVMVYIYSGGKKEVKIGRE
jgi:hypothetical protein